MKKYWLDILAQQTEPFIYVDCGARGEVANSLVDLLPRARYIGFEPNK